MFWSASYLFLHQHFACLLATVIVCKESIQSSQQSFTRCTECALFFSFQAFVCGCARNRCRCCNVAMSSTCIGNHWQHQSQGQRSSADTRVLSCCDQSSLSGNFRVNFGTVCIRNNVYQLFWSCCLHFHGVVTDMIIFVICLWSNFVAMCLMRIRYSMTSAVSFDSYLKWMKHSIMQYNWLLSLDSLRGVHPMSCMRCKYDVKHLKPQNTSVCIKDSTLTYWHNRIRVL